MESSKESRELEEVSVRAELNKNGLSVSTTSRIVVALDRLLGTFIEIPAVYLKRIELRIRNRTETESRIQKAATDHLVAAVANDEEINTIAAELALSSGLQPMVNRIEVARVAVRELTDLEAASKKDSEDQHSEVFDDDWMNHFTKYAELASSEKVRALWGRILAGEIRSAGSFSISSLRVICELDQRMADTFQSTVKHRIGGRHILKPKNEEMEGKLLEDLYFLSETGLLRAIDPIGGVQDNIRPNDEGIGVMEEQNVALFVGTPKPIGFPVIQLTRAGQELAKILPPPDPLAVLELVGNRIMDDVEFMELRLIISKMQNQLHTKPLKILKKRPDLSR